MPRVLVLALENWLGAARLPKALQSAGFEVSLLSYTNTLISLTKYADDRDVCVPTDSAESVAQRILALLDNKQTRLMIPADDRALRFMQHIAEVAHMNRLPKELTNLVAASLPDPGAFKYGEDKDAASQLMSDLGFRTPKRALIWSRQDLREFGAEAGLPVVLKPLSGTAGQGVQILRTEEDIAVAMIGAESKWMAQQYIVGKSAGTASVCLDGRCLGAIAFEKTLTYPGETGPASVITCFDSAEIDRASHTYAKATHHNGFLSLGFMVEEETNDPYFIETNARAVPLVGFSHWVGFDLCGALYNRLVGAPAPQKDPSAPKVIAFYPQELHRDPNSPYRKLILDEPTDDPAVHAAMQKGIDMLAAAT